MEASNTQADIELIRGSLSNTASGPASTESDVTALAETAKHLAEVVGWERMKNVLMSINYRIYQNYHSYGYKVAEMAKKYPDIDVMTSHTLNKQFENTQGITEDEYKIARLYQSPETIAGVIAQAFERGQYDYLQRKQISTLQ